MRIAYGCCAQKSYFTAKCFPAENSAQRVLRSGFNVNPADNYSYGYDSFGTRQVCGFSGTPHTGFVLESYGEVEVLQGVQIAGNDALSQTGAFLVPHGKCVPGAAITAYFNALPPMENICAYDRCSSILTALRRDFNYAAGVTGVNTTAEEALLAGAGVCQDYAHIYITLLRMAGVPARYVCGLTVGEGSSHAWVEALCEGNWIGLDPTNGRCTADGYIKFGHGRDAADCAINRGIVWGGGAQAQEVFASVEKKA